MDDDQLSQTYQIMSTNVLYSLNPIFDGPELKTAVQRAIEKFNRTQVCHIMWRNITGYFLKSWTRSFNIIWTI